MALKNRFYNLIKEYKNLFSSGEYVRNLLIGIVMLATGSIATFFADKYVTAHIGPAVPDFFLSILPNIPVSGIYIYAPFVFLVVIFVILIGHPKKMPFVMSSLGLAILIRAIFVCMTHMGYPTGMQWEVVNFKPTLFSFFNTQGDFFFSGHTGFPYLLALMFWEHPFERDFFLAVSVILAATVLVGRFHYSIDVFAAYPIIYSIYLLSRKLFKKEFARLKSSDPE